MAINELLRGERDEFTAQIWSNRLIEWNIELPLMRWSVWLFIFQSALSAHQLFAINIANILSEVLADAKKNCIDKRYEFFAFATLSSFSGNSKMKQKKKDNRLKLFQYLASICITRLLYVLLCKFFFNERIWKSNESFWWRWESLFE